jgi:hypothetical protein
MHSPVLPIPDRLAGSVDPGKVRAHLDGILASPAFATAKSAGRFLCYIVDETLAGRGDQIKEYVIGVVVFGRGNSYDPRTDAVVRVEATRLRRRLREYYRRDGTAESVIIEIPKGCYVPIFRSLDPAIGWRGNRDADASFQAQSIAVMPLENLSGDDSQGGGVGQTRTLPRHS